MSFRAIFTIFMKDLKAVFVSPLFYVIASLCTAVWSLMFFTGLQNFAELSMRVAMRSRGEMPGVNIHEQLFKGHVGLVNFFLIFAVAAITMRLISEEKRNRTFDLLWTSPVSATEIILGKFLSGIAAVWALILVSSLYPISAGFFAEVEWGPLFSAYLGMLLLGACYVSVGLFASSLTQSSVLSVFVALIMNISLWLVAVGADVAENPTIVAIFQHVSVGLHFQDFLSGVIKISSILLFLSICLLLCMLAESSIKFSAVSVEAEKMKRSSKAFLILSGISFVSVFIGRFLVGGWFPFLWVFLASGFLFAVFTLVFEYRLFAAFFALKTTKRGLNVGVITSLMLVLLMAINYISYKRDKTWDLTTNQINTLSEQSQKVLESLDERLRLVLLFADEQKKNEIEQQIRPLIRKYENYTKNILFETHDVNKKPGLAKEFGFTRGAFGLFMRYKERTVPVRKVSEEDLTNAMAKLSKNTKKVIYFVQGHGELSIESAGDDPKSISFLRSEMESTFYEVRELNLLSSEIPKDAGVIAIVGPRSPMVPGEIEKLKNFARSGGSLLIAADPGEAHNIGELTQLFGVEFSDQVILDDAGQLVGRGPTTTFGIPSTSGTEITKNFPNSPSLHLLASPLKKIPVEGAKLSHKEIVTSQASTRAIDELKQDAKMVGKGPFTMGYVVQGSLPMGDQEKGKSSESKEFSVVIYGDSDFMANIDINNQPVNYNLALNSFNYLSDDKEFIGIRPKKLSSTPITLTTTQSSMYLLFFIFPLPLLFFSSGAVIWFRRRSA